MVVETIELLLEDLQVFTKSKSRFREVKLFSWKNGCLLALKPEEATQMILPRNQQENSSGKALIEQCLYFDKLFICWKPKKPEFKPGSSIANLLLFQPCNKV